MGTYGIGATIRLGAGIRQLSMSGKQWNLIDLDRSQTRGAAGLISDAKGLAPHHPHNNRKHAKGTRTHG